MAHAQYHYSNSSDSLEYPEQPSYPYLYARSEAGHTTPAVSHAPLPPPSVAPSHRSSVFVGSRGPIPTRTYSDTSRSSGDSYITPSLSASQVGNRHRANYAHSAGQPRSRATSFVSRDDLRRSSVHPSQAYASSRPPPMAMSPARPPTVFTAGSSSSKPIMRRLRGVLKKTRPHGDGSSHTSSSSAPDVIEDSQTDMSSLPELNFPVPPSMIPHAQSAISDNRRSMAPSSIVQRTRFHGNAVHVSRHLSKSWDARSPPRLDNAARAAPAFDLRGIPSVQLIVSGLPWSVHVRAGSSGRSRSRSRVRVDHITVGDVVDSVYAALNKSLTRTDVRAATNDTKKRIARAAAAAETESERGEHSARTGKPSAARRIDYLGSRVWFQGLEKDDQFAREEGYGVTEQELRGVWVMRFASSPGSRSAAL